MENESGGKSAKKIHSSKERLMIWIMRDEFSIFFFTKHQDGFFHIFLWWRYSNLFLSHFSYDLANSPDNQSRPSYNPLPCTAQVAWMYHWKKNVKNINFHEKIKWLKNVPKKS